MSLNSSSSSSSSPTLPPIYSSLEDLIAPENPIVERSQDYLDSFNKIGNRYSFKMTLCSILMGFKEYISKHRYQWW